MSGMKSDETLGFFTPSLLFYFELFVNNNETFVDKIKYRENAIITGHRLTRTLIDVWPTKSKQQNFPASFSTSSNVTQLNYKFLVHNIASAESEKMNNQHLLPNMNERSSYTFFTTKESPENWHVARLVPTAQLRPEKKAKF